MTLDEIYRSHDRVRAMSPTELANEVAAVRRHLANLAGRVSTEDADALQRVCHLIVELRHRAGLPIVFPSLTIPEPVGAMRPQGD